MHGQPHHDGLSDSDLRGLQWRKGQRSSATGNCVETAKLPDGGVAIRNSRFPDGPVLRFRDAEIGAFLEGVKDGELDDLLG